MVRVVSGRTIHVRMPLARPRLDPDVVTGALIFALPRLIWFAACLICRLVRPVLHSPRTMTGPMKACMLVFIVLVAVTALRWFAEDPASDLRLQVAIWCVILAPLGIAGLFVDRTP